MAGGRRDDASERRREVREADRERAVRAHASAPERSDRWCRGTELNRRHRDFQSRALPTELPRHALCGSDRTSILTVLCSCTFARALVLCAHPVTTRIDALPIPIVRRDRARLIRVAVLLASVLILADALFGDRGYAGRLTARHEYVRMTQDFRELQTQNAGLRQQIRRLQTDPQTIEAIAREELGLARRDELLVIVAPRRTQP